jgi:hypothetical protein
MNQDRNPVVTARNPYRYSVRNNIVIMTLENAMASNIRVVMKMCDPNSGLG